MRGLAVLPLAISLLLPGVASAQELTGAQIKELLSGKTGSWQSVDGKIKGKTGWGADGRGAVTGNFGDFDQDTGKWRVKGDQYCTRWSKIRKGKESCNPVISLGNGSYQVGNSVFKLK